MLRLFLFFFISSLSIANESPEWLATLEKAQHGDAEQQFLLGTHFELGLMTPKDEAAAFEWYRKAAEQGHAGAQFKLGIFYAYGLSVDKDMERAVEWYLKSAQQGDMHAQYNLASCYLKGMGVAHNKEKAFEWIKCSAEQGYPDAQFNLAYCYSLGIGTALDRKQAIHWFEKCALAGDEQAVQQIKKLKAQELPSGDISPELREFYRAYLSQSWEASANLLEKEGKDIPFISFFDKLQIQYEYSYADMPSDYQAYIKEWRLVVNALIDELNEAEMEQKASVLDQAVSRLEALKKQFPEAARAISYQQAQAYLLQNAQLTQAMDKINADLMAQKSPALTPNQVLIQSLRAFAKLVRSSPDF